MWGALQIAQALASLHGQGLAHMDVKPDNIVMGDDGLYKLGDFGLACCLAGTSPDVTFSEGDCRCMFVYRLHPTVVLRLRGRMHESSTSARLNCSRPWNRFVS